MSISLEWTPATERLNRCRPQLALRVRDDASTERANRKESISGRGGHYPHAWRKGDTGRAPETDGLVSRVRERWQIQRGAQQRMQGNVHGHESGLNARRWTLPRPPARCRLCVLACVKPLLLATSVRYRGSRSISPGSARERLRPGLLLSALVAAAAAAATAAAAAAAAAAIAAVVVAAIPRARLARELQRPAAHCFTPF